MTKEEAIETLKTYRSDKDQDFKNKRHGFIITIAKVIIAPSNFKNMDGNFVLHATAQLQDLNIIDGVNDYDIFFIQLKGPGPDYILNLQERLTDYEAV